MRGKGVSTGFARAYPRITPAYAGKRADAGWIWSRPPDHPRVCGEKVWALVRAVMALGSPPHVRGKDPEPHWRAVPAGDHPRMCGEKHAVQIAQIFGKGSPPHVRGKAGVALLSGQIVGITPACAGKRLKRSRSTVPPVAIVPLFPSVCNKPVVSDGSPAGRDAPLFLPAENAVPASPAYNLRSL